MTTSTVTSEALQLKLRQLLPSQQGFGTDLTASDTIIPIIDLTAAAEGSDVPEYLQTAIAFGSATVFDANNSSVVLANTPGFYRIYGSVTLTASSAGDFEGQITITDGSTTKVVWGATDEATSNATGHSFLLDFVIFLRVGDSCSAVSSSDRVHMNGSVRQVADSNGTLVQPSGFNPQ